MASRTVDLYGGSLRMHCVTWGRESATPVLLLHGLRAYGHWFDEFGEAASDDFYLIAPDQRGRGQTDWAKDGTYDTDAYVQDILELARLWPLQRFAIVGHSMGGTNAINFAAKYPDRVSALVIVDSAPELSSVGLSRIARETAETPQWFDSREAALAGLQKLHPRASRRHIETRLRCALSEQNGKFGWRLDPAIFPLKPDPADRTWSALAAIECPTLVMRAGDSDLVTVDGAGRMVETLKQGELVTVANAGHMVIEDNPDGFIKAALPFLQKYAQAG